VERTRRDEPGFLLEVRTRTRCQDLAPPATVGRDERAHRRQRIEIPDRLGEQCPVRLASDFGSADAWSLDQTRATRFLLETRGRVPEHTRVDALAGDGTCGSIKAGSVRADEQQPVQPLELRHERLRAARAAEEHVELLAHGGHVRPIVADDLVRRTGKPHDLGARQARFELGDGEGREQHRPESRSQQRLGVARGDAR
jgi:hypothetical protein